ncbi:hypothetical protein ALC56_05905 [Trachymyrmex septentrionalis]|uniref:Double jelly roll-like domain-containing protein n=1 Tax=Trachymyrmex septentrionalis TaxID=34720 RepID=A0A151JX76_9HYME|nr:hypothetical protein ALC56_05905 [Trachymyrmex septentrionalis]
MFDEIRYELDGVEIDRSRNDDIIRTIKNFVSLTISKSITLESAGWDGTVHLFRTPSSEDFNFCVPLTLLGFCEDYKRIVINARHELILIHARNDNNCVAPHESTEPKITLLKIQWKMPHIVLNDVNKLSLLRTLEGGRYLSMCFRSWNLYKFPLLQSTTNHSWAVKTSQLEKPRYVIFALQTGKRNVPSQNLSQFDVCNLTNVKLFLNSDFYPYDEFRFRTQGAAILYDMYVKFQKTYYGYNNRDAMLSIFSFLYKNATMDIRIEFECKENIPLNTTAYCLIIHDRVIEYNPLTNVIRKIV